MKGRCMARPVDPEFGARLRALMERNGVSLRSLARRTFYSKSYLWDLTKGVKPPSLTAAQTLDDALDARGALIGLVPDLAEPADLELSELAQRVAASDMSAETLTRLERGVDELACAYATTAPALLLPAVRRNLAYVGRLVEVRKTLDQSRRLLVAGGWFALLSATLAIDLRQRPEARASLATAQTLAEQAEHAEIQAWCLETKAWDVLTDGSFAQAARLSRQAQAIAPSGSSAMIQSTAQEGRAWARMGRAPEARKALQRTAKLVSALPMPDSPEHHYRYDPAKAVSYTATTLAWAGDAAAEEAARSALADLHASGEDVRRPRRVVAAQLDLSLALVAARKPDEAAAMATTAITTGRVVPSNWWRAAEIMSGVDSLRIAEVHDLREAFETYRPRSV
jgi:transcriptional regulator with XRE-family HTH domain/tetratricopeptide (TPR) repeat protein